MFELDELALWLRLRSVCHFGAEQRVRHFCPWKAAALCVEESQLASIEQRSDIARRGNTSGVVEVPRCQCGYRLVPVH
jgi:hypothetical protein